MKVNSLGGGGSWFYCDLDDSPPDLLFCFSVSELGPRVLYGRLSIVRGLLWAVYSVAEVSADIYLHQISAKECPLLL